MKLRSALIAMAVLALPAAAIAQPVDGLYVGAGAGYNYAQDQDVKSVTGAMTTGSPKLTTNGGVIGSASVGYGFGNGFRVELQGDYRNFHEKSTGGTGVTASGLNQTYGGFVNGLFDFDVGADFVYPYVGVGIGYEETKLKGTLNGVSASADAGSVAGQAILGAAFPIPDLPGLSVTAEYRFMATFSDNEKFDNAGASAKLGHLYNHAGLLGLRYALGVEAPPMAAPAPVAAPTPAPARTYLVFFDWDKSDLSARARQIIGEAAQNASKVKVTRIEVNGYADLSGTHAYNLPLSQRRADAVAAELVKDGIAKSEIVEMAYGDSHPLVPTAAGVREPQNRRVEIILK
jgi:outer membrane protein OmpA-like peptidoglycan-associated protein